MIVREELPGLKVEIDEKSSVIILHWSNKFTVEEFRQACLWCLERVTALKIKFWLADSSNIARLETENQKWTSGFLLPKLSEVGLKKMALVIPEDLYSHLAISTIIVEAKDNIQFDTHYFVKVEEALAWLK
ncbi:hypothetical protein [Rufibacter roseus]|uniref:STAS/SEC14 domain-containing protein n=1 Tax=Rufibacter roseus TaxID=1567108 RepID=A0ABW2DGE4_9BACT|nr:hypothetical protein [Rufibacter roseus]